MNFLGATANSWTQIIIFLVALLLLSKPLGSYIAKVFMGEKNFLSPILKWPEKFIYKFCSIDSEKEMNWKEYNFSVLIFSLICFVGLFFILKFQGSIGQIFGFNPQNFPNLTADLSFNTAISFITNTNWQSYGGESTMSYVSQALGLTVQNFLSAAVGMAVLVALIRGLTRKNTSNLGNFWVDLVRGNLYILLPLSIIFTLLFVSQGVVQTASSYIDANLLEASGEITKQTIAVGPSASQIAIKQLGTNGGGFFNVNSAHPFENPTPFSNFLELLAILLIPAALCFSFEKMINEKKQGKSILTAMMIIFVFFLIFTLRAEYQTNPALTKLNVEQIASDNGIGGNMEGKETRFGVTNSVLWATATTAASNGSVNSMHESFTAIGGMGPLLLMQFGEVIFGGAGSGLYGMLLFVLLTVFIAGLMVGRTPEYLGKKINAFEMKMICIAIILPSMAALIGTAIAVSFVAGKSAILASGAHGFSEVLYALTSAANNNGSAFAGLSANSPFYNYLLGIAMIIGRFAVVIPVLAIAGSLAKKKVVPQSAGTLPTHTPLFIFFLILIIILIGVLTYAPSLALGPVADHLNLIK